MTRRSGWAAIVAALSILLIGIGFASLRSSSTPVDVATAVERFRGAKKFPIVSAKARRTEVARRARSSSGSAMRAQAEASGRVDAPRGRPLPADGVYVYATTGGEEVDVLGGSRHTYPEETTITVRHGGCGFVERWDALDERWDERESCRIPRGDKLKRTTAHHEFFGHADTRTLECDGLTYPAAAEPGDVWTMRCASVDTTTDLRLTAVAWEDIDVGGTAVRTLHVHVDGKISGEQEGRTIRDVWGAVDSGISVRERATLTSYSTQPVFGRTRYHESYEVLLKSLEPRR